MADASLLLPNNTNKFMNCCSTYYSNQTCPNGDRCPFLHKTPQEVHPMHGSITPEFFVGTARTTQRCRYYAHGNCLNRESCPYVHANDSVTFSMGETSQAPSTSNQLFQTHVIDLNSGVTTALTNLNKMFRPGHGINTYDVEKIRLGQPNRPAIIERPPALCPEEMLKKARMNAEAAAAAAAAASSSSSWVNAPEFVPKLFQQQDDQQQQKPKSYAEAVIPSEQRNEPQKRLCPFMNKDGICRNLIDCNYVHGELCDMCGRLVLHPYDEELRKKHRQECLEQHEKNMELSFAIARSKEKTCGVCFEVIMEKANGEQRFGILPNCNHCFCLICIRKWRQARQFENKIIRACPECRVTSDFVCPSMYWVDTKEDKEKLIDDYKKALATKDCKYFKKGHGKCPFGNKCFYLHALQDGRKCDVGPPPRRRPHYTIDFSALDSPEFQEVLQQVMLWDFLNERDAWSWLSDDFDTESDESEWSDIIFD